jgi:hypothetical protein
MRAIDTHRAQLEAIAERRAPALGSWLDGVAMDPAAIAPEPLPPLPGFPFLHAGSGAVVVGPTGGGRSSLVQACAYDAAREGLRVAYLGCEVTEAEFQARAGDLALRRDDAIDDTLRTELAAVRYLNLASVIALAWENPDGWVVDVAARFDVLAIDPLSAVASTLDLDFDQSKAEFVRFYDRLVQPLVAGGTTVLMLDNVGHAIEARGRAKGASAKSDRADLTFACSLQTNPVGLVVTARKVRTVRAPFARGQEWIFDRETQRVTRRGGEQRDGAAFRPTTLMERVSRAIEDKPGLTRRALRAAVKGKHEAKQLALELLIAEGYVEQREDGAHPTHHSVMPYRADHDTGPRSPCAPRVDPEASGSTVVPRSLTYKDRGTGDHPAAGPVVVPNNSTALGRAEAPLARHTMEAA